MMLRFPARAVFQWPVLDMAEKAMVQKQWGKKNAKKVPELWIRVRGKMFEEYSFALGGVCQKMRAEKLRKVAGKYIYKRVFEYICREE